MGQLEFTLSQTQNSIIIEAHTVNVAILSQQVGVMLAAGYLLDQNIVAAHLGDRNIFFFLNADQVCFSHHVDPCEVVILHTFHILNLN